MADITFQSDGRLYEAYLKDNEKYDIYCDRRLVGLAVHYRLVTILYHACQNEVHDSVKFCEYHQHNECDCITKCFSASYGK